MLMDLLFEGVIRGLETVSDAIEFGPINAVKINSEFIPQAERDYRRIMRDIDSPSTSSTTKPEQKPSVNTTVKDTKQEFKKLPVIIEDTKAEIVSETFGVGSVAENIAAAIHEFELDTYEDRQLAQCFILAFLQYNKLIKKDVIKLFLASEEDKGLYINIIAWFESSAAGYIKNAGKNISLEQEVVAELKELLEWEMGYIKDILSNRQIVTIQNGFKDILKNLKELKEDVIDPLEFTSENHAVPKSGFSDEEKKNILSQLYSEFRDIMADYRDENGFQRYKFNMLNEIAELLVMDDNFNIKGRYRIDPDIIMGNGTNLIYYYYNADGKMEDIYINVKKRPDIIRNIINQNISLEGIQSYNMAPEEVTSALADTFVNKQIYYFVDMSSFSKTINVLKQADINKLGDKLSAVSNMLSAPNGVPDVRVRLKEWKNLNNFTLVSDEKCRSPFATNMTTCMAIAPGMEISVVKDSITVEYLENGSQKKTVEFVIKK